MRKYDGRKKWRVIIGILSLLLLAAKVFTWMEADKVRTAVILDDLSDIRRSIAVCYISMNRRDDPSSALIRRIQGSGINARKASSDPQWPNWGMTSSNHDSPNAPVKPLEMKLDLSSITWRGPFVAEIVCSRLGGGTRYKLVRGLRWSVVKKDTAWIS